MKYNMCIAFLMGAMVSGAELTPQRFNDEVDWTKNSLLKETRKEVFPKEKHAKFMQQADALRKQVEQNPESLQAAYDQLQQLKAEIKALRNTDFFPSIPAMRPVSKTDAEKLLKADWLFQANHQVTSARIAQEIGWAKQLATRIDSMKGADKTAEARTAALKKIEKLEREIPKTSGKDKLEELYIDIRRAKREIMFSNPTVDFDRILLIDSPHPETVHSNHESGHRNGSQQFNSGSKLQIISGLNPNAVVQNLLPDDLDTYIWRPDLSYDAEKIIFSKKDHFDPSFKLFEVNVDGSGLKQLTNSDYDDLDPIYLPDGNILFSTTRAHTYVRCLPTSPAFVLARADADGKNIRIISRNNEPDYLPAMMPDGSVIYTRWEYTERPLWRLQGLWTMNPDGTNPQIYWGNRTFTPDMLIEARPIPGTGKVMFVGQGHHRVFSGSLGVINLSEGREHPDGIYKITSDLVWPETGDPKPPHPTYSPNYHVSGSYGAYKTPYPIGENDFLVSVRSGPGNSGGNRVSVYNPFSLYLMDMDGNRELIYRGNNNILYAMPLKPRPVPPARADTVDWPKKGEPAKDGVLYSADVYEGIEKDLPRGTAKYLRILEMDAKTYTSMVKSFRHSGPAVSIIQEDGVKRILGTVPVEEDGSVHFKVPSGKALHFQLLDKDYRCLQIMRSFTGVMPGETRGCTGCHEQDNRTPVAFQAASTALRRAPSEITPPPWGPVSISYERFAQPVLDKHCGSCHQGDKNPKARKALDLTLRGGLPELGVPKELWPFKQPYLTLVGPTWFKGRHEIKNVKSMPSYSPVKYDTPGTGIAGALQVEADNGNFNVRLLKPRTVLSYTSPLIKMVREGTHKNVKIEGDDLRRLMAWVDANCVYRGDKEIRMIPDPVGPEFDRFAVRPTIKNAPVIDRLQPVTDNIDGK
ncbi:hypothetical protein PDESU_02148 [Pontiella desulfatans]|uniref:Hydrazine synthase alpha subunit middle domain-containing protein n=1 Tax=Pontiella desulfatans TaxID=2750659 RepID=A0A6C2U1X7_PONDE|nr:PD40 domain-containing protein [Pontiella desulfatans]VGO13591.1 hypothetical protein PDESU_02148 [Pontiella desulfatans]